MKNYSLIWKGVFLLTIMSTLTFCSTDEIREENENQFDTKLDPSITAQTKIIETRFNTDARLATLYTLQYAKSINPEFRLDPVKGNTPFAVPGESIEKYIDLDKLPVEREELAFIKEKVLHKESKIFVLPEVYDPKSKENINIVYIPYPAGIDVPENFVHQHGILIDDWIIHEPWWWWQQSGFLRTSWSWHWNCYCFIIYRPFNYWDCFICPFYWREFIEYLDPIIVDPYLYEKVFTDPIPIEKIPFGKSLFDFAL